MFNGNLVSYRINVSIIYLISVQTLFWVGFETPMTKV